MPDLMTQLMLLVGKPQYQPLKAKALARRLGVPQVDYPNFRHLLQHLIKEGRLEVGKGQTIQPAKPHGTVTGVFRKLASGAGIVRVHAPSTVKRDAGEVYIPAQGVADASTGDEVLVRLTKKPKQRDRSPQGEIVRVVERQTQQFVGTYFIRSDGGYVAVDGTTFHEPIWVGDAGAKGAKPEDKVVFEMIRFPSPQAAGEGVITEVIGPRGQPGVDTLSIIRAFALPDVFPPDVLSEARQIVASFDENDLAGRVDFREQLVITIDPADAHDFDDAVSLSYDPRKHHWHLTVHVADVSHFVPPGSLMDREAKQRGTSVYLPRRVLPMIPELISNGVASLQEKRLRYTHSVRMEFTAKGERVHAEIVPGVVSVQHRFAYAEATALLDGHPRKHLGKLPWRSQEAGSDAPPKSAPCPPAVLDMLKQMKDFALILHERRKKRGALELNMPEVELEYDDHGQMAGAHFVERGISNQIIEEFMLATNEAVAEFLQQHQVPFLRRVHAAPDPLKLEQFIHFVKGLGYKVNIDRPTDRFQLQRLLEESANQPQRHAVHYALLRSLKQAEYTPEEDGHYALASKHYCHFTSPIRRYPDLLIHRLVHRLRRNKRAGNDEGELVALGEHCSFTERRADRAEMELVKLKLLTYLSSRLGMEMEILLTGVEEYGFFGQAAALPVEGLVHVNSLTDDDYYYDERSFSLVGRRQQRRFRLGDRVKVKVARVDIQRRQLDFKLADPEPRVQDERRRRGRRQR